MNGRTRPMAKGKVLSAHILDGIEDAMVKVWESEAAKEHPLWRMNCLIYAGKKAYLRGTAGLLYAA